MKFIVISVLIVLLFSSCISKESGDELRLLPQPQQITLRSTEGHLLKRGRIAPECISEKKVPFISEAVTNPDEAYHLTITPDSVRIEAATAGEMGLSGEPHFCKRSGDNTAEMGEQPHPKKQ